MILIEYHPDPMDRLVELRAHQARMATAASELRRVMHKVIASIKEFASQIAEAFRKGIPSELLESLRNILDPTEIGIIPEMRQGRIRPERRPPYRERVFHANQTAYKKTDRRYHRRRYVPE